MSDEVSDNEKTQEVKTLADGVGQSGEKSSGFSGIQDQVIRLGSLLKMATEVYENLSKIILGDVKPVVHACPQEGDSGLTPCCGRSPFELPLNEQISLDYSAITCNVRSR